VDALCAFQEEAGSGVYEKEPRLIPLYCSPAAAGYAAPVFGEDFDYIEVAEDVPQAAEFAVRIQGDSMIPFIGDGSVVYVNRDPLKAGDVGIFCVDGEMLCKQYYRDPLGMVYLFSLNRARADADVLLSPAGGRSLTCFGRVIMHAPPLPGKE
jgi:phage repressor protein C with HTH and peptisase S24 domain